METDLFVTVQSTEELPGFVQVEACAKEAEKMATLIETQSHRIVSELALSALTVANVVPVSTISVNSGGTSLVMRLGWFCWSNGLFAIYYYIIFSKIHYL